MKILHFLNTINDLGNGIVNATVDLACTQARGGHQVIIASEGGGFETFLRERGVAHEKIELRRTPTGIARACALFNRLAKRIEPNVVHSHMMTASVLSRMMRFSTRSSYALVSTVHNEFRRDSILMGSADRVIAVSTAVAESMERRGIPRERLRIVKNGTLGSPRQPALRDIVPKTLTRPAITTVAGMFERKGIADLIQAFSSLPRQYGANLYIVGDGPDRQRFEALAASSASRDRIHFEGFQPVPGAYLVSTDIFVLASRAEPWGLAISEAREAGCAIVATAVGGIPEQLEGGRAGILVPPNSSVELAAALERLLADSSALSDARARAKTNIEWLGVERVCRETVGVYEELLAERSAASKRR